MNFNIDIKPAVPKGPNPLNVAWCSSVQSDWCWAACAEMVLEYLCEIAGKKCDIEKCDIVDFIKRRSDCCQKPNSGACNAPCCICDVEAIYDKYGVKSSLVKGALSFPDLRTEIAGGRPVEAGFRDGAKRHLVILHGAREVSGTLYVDYNDPASGSGAAVYTEVAAHKWGVWEYTWAGIWK